VNNLLKFHTELQLPGRDFNPTPLHYKSNALHKSAALIGRQKPSRLMVCFEAEKVERHPFRD